MDLGETRIGEGSATSMGPPGCGDIGGHRVCRQIEDVGVSAGGENNCMARVAGDLTGDQIANHHTNGSTVLDHDIEHFGSRVQLDLASVDLTHEGRVGAQQKLLTGGTTCIKRSGDLSTAEGAVVEKTAVLPGEGNALSSRLIDDVQREFGQTVDVGFPTPKVTTLNRVIEESINGVAIVVIVLGGVDPTLCGDGVGPSW